jgi:hypothetical protein
VILRFLPDGLETYRCDGIFSSLMTIIAYGRLVMLDLVAIINGIDAVHEISKISPGLPVIMFKTHLLNRIGVSAAHR